MYKSVSRVLLLTTISVRGIYLYCSEHCKPMNTENARTGIPEIDRRNPRQKPSTREPTIYESLTDEDRLISVIGKRKTSKCSLGKFFSLRIIGTCQTEYQTPWHSGSTRSYWLDPITDEIVIGSWRLSLIYGVWRSLCSIADHLLVEMTTRIHGNTRDMPSLPEIYLSKYDVFWYRNPYRYQQRAG